VSGPDPHDVTPRVKIASLSLRDEHTSIILLLQRAAGVGCAVSGLIFKMHLPPYPRGEGPCGFRHAASLEGTFYLV
jgi:hypothetical protein